MYKIIFILSIDLLSLTGAFSQSVQLDTFLLKPSERFEEIASEKLYFPIVRSGNQKVDSLINTDIKNRFTNYEYTNESLDSALAKFGEGIIALDFKVTYNQKGILSLNIRAEGCGAYCTVWTDYFNYLSESGEQLVISELIDTTGKFRKIVVKDMLEQYSAEENRLKEWLEDSESGLGQQDYDSALEYYNECKNSFDLNEFALFPGYLEIIEDCYVPHVMLPFKPYIDLKYEYGDIESYLKMDL